MAAKKKTKGRKSKQAHQADDEDQNATFPFINGEDLINVSPSRVRFQHSRIRPFFSGCGRSVTDTLDEIRRGSLEPRDLPPIQVLVGPDEDDGLGPWYFSLNNRRLWVLKQCHKEGLLDNERYNNTIPVRVRIPKSRAEAERYSVENCALEAKFMREGAGGAGGGKSNKKKNGKGNGAVQSGKCSHSASEGEEVSLGDGAKETSDEISGTIARDEDDLKNCKNDDISESEIASESESDGDIASDNPFSALF